MLISSERRNRIRLSVAAWAYEHSYRSHLTDKQYDELSRAINPRMATGNPRIDFFFKTHFDPDTGLWIHKHPELEKLEQLYMRVYYPFLYRDKIRRAQRRQRRKNR